MKRLFYIFLKDQGLTVEEKPSRASLRELFINFNHWANSIERGPHRQGLRVIGKYLAV